MNLYLTSLSLACKNGMGAPFPSTQTHSDRILPTRSAAHTCDTDGRAQAKSLKFNLQSNAELRKALMDPAGTYRGAPLSVAALLALRGAELARADTQERRRAHEEEALFHRNLANFDLPLDGGASAGGGGREGAGGDRMGAGEVGGRSAAGHEQVRHRESATVAAQVQGARSRRDPRACGGDSGGGSASGSSASDSDGSSDIGDSGSVTSGSSSSDQDLPLAKLGPSEKAGPTDGGAGVGVESSSEDDLPLAQIAQR